MQVHQSDADGIEILGGTVDLRYVVVTAPRDDGLDWAIGWRGRAQHVIVQQFGDGGRRGLEGDNQEDDPDATPRSIPTISHATLIGSSTSPSGHAGLSLRRGSGLRGSSFLGPSGWPAPEPGRIPSSAEPADYRQPRALPSTPLTARCQRGDHAGGRRPAMAYSHTRYTVAHSVPDQDGDEFGAHEDCNDNDPAIHPRAVEVVADGIDQNCDGAERCYADQDWDGFLPREPREKESDDLDCDDPGEGDSASPRGDCDDRNPRTFPGADEVVGDEVDQDCDGIEVCFVDDDGDGWRTEESRVGDDRLCDREGEAAASQPAGDCDDGSADIRPGAEDLVDDGIDQDCDGEDSISPPPAAPESPPSSGCSTASAAPPPWTWLALVIAVVAGRTRLMNRAEPASDT